MPLYKIRRGVPGASREDVDASAFRAVACAIEFDGLHWVRSFWDEAAGELTCLYEAASAAQVLAHAERARIPCDSVAEVTEITPDEYLQG